MTSLTRKNVKNLKKAALASNSWLGGGILNFTKNMSNKMYANDGSTMWDKLGISLYF